MDNVKYLEITTNLLLDIDITSGLLLFNEKFKNLEILFIKSLNVTDYNNTIDLIKHLLLNSNFVIKLVDSNNNIIMSFIDFSNISTIKNVNDLIENLILHPHIKFLTISNKKKIFNPQLLLYIYYFSVARHLHLACKDQYSTKILKKIITRNNNLIDVNFDNL